jgi:hypothetical protein
MIEYLEGKCRFGIKKRCRKQPGTQKLYMFFWSIRTCTQLQCALEYTSGGDYDRSSSVGYQLVKTKRLGVIVYRFHIVLPVTLIVVTTRIRRNLLSGDTGDTRRAFLNMWTDVQLKTQVVQVIALKESIDKPLDPMKWLCVMLGEATFVAIKILEVAIFATISTCSRQASRT